MKPRYIIHVDMDAFFASIEERDHPEYKGKPIVVGADPKGGRGRGVVSTCSYAARRFGIHSAMPISTAYRRCPHAVFLPVNMEKYSRVSERIFSILREFTPAVEVISIDEAFLDISGTYKLFGARSPTKSTPRDVALLIKERIKGRTGLTASIGLGPTKMAAKIASGLKKPDGLVEVTDDELPGFLRPLDVEKLWGVGTKTKAILNGMGITTVGDLAKRPQEELVSVFGKNGEWFWEMAHGIDESDVLSEREAKSISNEITFERDTRDKDLIIRSLVRLCEEVAGRLRDSDLKCRTITLKIRVEGFQTYTRATTIAEPTNYSEVFIKEIKQLYADFEGRSKKVRLVGVRASKFSSAEEKDLFTAKEDSKNESVHKALDTIRHRFGSDSISRASGK